MIAQTPVVPLQGTKLQEDAVPVTFQTVGVFNPLDAAETSSSPGLTSTFYGVSEVTGAPWLDVGGSMVQGQSAALPSVTIPAVRGVQKPADNKELATPVLTAELLDPTQMMSAAATTPEVTPDFVSEFQQEKDITEQLLGTQDEELSITTPKKKRPSSPENEDPIVPKPKRVAENPIKEPREPKADNNRRIKMYFQWTGLL